jgi:hypothetical protein
MRKNGVEGDEKNKQKERERQGERKKVLESTTPSNPILSRPMRCPYRCAPTPFRPYPVSRNPRKHQSTAPN